MSLACAVCGSDRVTETMETEGHTVALCALHYQAAKDAADHLAAREIEASRRALEALERIRQRDGS